MSQNHAKVTVHGNHIVVEDLGSTNGIFIQTRRIKTAKIKLNQSFRIGYFNLFLKEGNPQDFVISKKVQPVLSKISDILTAKEEKTHAAIKLLYAEPLIEMLQIGFELEEFVDIFQFSRKILHKILKEGCLLLITRENDNTIIESRWNYRKDYYPLVLEILQIEDAFQKSHIDEPCGESHTFCSFPFIASSRSLLMIYLRKSNRPIPAAIIDFLKDLSVEIAIIDSLIEQNKIKSEATGGEVPEIVTKNQILLNLLSKCKKIARSDLFVIIKGETGTGKELFARYIHAHSRRYARDFVAVNCAAIPETLMENELFGHEKGAFTDAKERRIGKLESSSGGTLVLDEIGDMPLSLQKKLLRAIQEGQFYRIGGNKPITVDVRIICLTHTDISGLLKNGRFREDLFYRLNHVTLKILPLRERKNDIIPLINYFVKIFSEQNKISIKGFSQKAIKALESYDWPGNVRELKNEIHKMVSLSETNEVIDLSMLKEEIVDTFNERQARPKKSTVNEKETILKLLKKHQWNKTRVAGAMNISRTALYEKLKKYDIN